MALICGAAFCILSADFICVMRSGSMASVMMKVWSTIAQPQLWTYLLVQRSQMNSGRAIGPNQPKFTKLRRSLSAPLIAGTGTASNTSSDLGPTNSRSLDSPGRPKAMPSTSAGLVSLGLLGSVGTSTAPRSVTTTKLSTLSGIKMAPKYELLTPTQSKAPCSVFPPGIFLIPSCSVSLLSWYSSWLEAYAGRVVWSPNPAGQDGNA